MAEQGRAEGVMPRAESLPAEDRGDVVALVEQLHRAGWSIGDVPLRGERGGLIWIVLGRRGADLLVNIQNSIDEAECYETIRAIRWLDGVACPHGLSLSVGKVMTIRKIQAMHLLFDRGQIKKILSWVTLIVSGRLVLGE